MTFEEFTAKLKSIHRIYAELCETYGVSIAEHPLHILKVESGSLWVQIAGYAPVIAVMTLLLNKGVELAYKRYTQQGQIETIADTAASISAVLDLRNSLAESGLTIEGMDEAIEKSSIHISKDLGIIIANRPKIRINEKRHSLNEDLQKQLGSDGQIQRLEILPSDD